MNHPVSDSSRQFLATHVSSENASEPFGLGSASLERLLNLEDPDEVGGELTGRGPLVLTGDALAVVVLHEVQQRGPCDGPRIDALHQDGAQVIAFSTVGARIGVELLLVLVG